MTDMQTRPEEAAVARKNDNGEIPSPREVEEFEFEPTIVRGRE